jgi:hypothetical protein
VPITCCDQAQINLEVVNAGSYNISIIDVTGKLISTVHSGTLSFGNHRFDVGKVLLPNAGIYFIQVDNGQGRKVRKVVVQ